MSTTKFYTGAGAVFNINGSNIGNVEVMTLDSPQLELQDVTNLSSPKYGGVIYQEQVASKVNAGKFEGSALYVANDPGMLALRTAFSTANLSVFTLTLPAETEGNVQTTTGDVFSWTGYVMESPVPAISSADKVMTYKISTSMLSVLTTTSGS